MGTTTHVSHGFTPDSLILGTMMPIPKNKKKSFCSFSNWHRKWIDNGKVDTGWFAVILRSTRSKYNYLIRSLKRNGDSQIRGALGRALLTHDNRS